MPPFDTAKRGELAELDAQLNSRHHEERKTAVKKVIAQMTVGKDLSNLFQSVVKCLENPDMELKKLVTHHHQVYLYIINYSRNRPDDAIMVINIFRKDSLNKSNPIIRALAVRTMGCLRVPKLNQYLMGPLENCLKDDDPYVRKTAVLCAPKGKTIQLVIQISNSDQDTQIILNTLLGMLQREANALVLANLIASLQQIQNLKGKNYIKIQGNILNKLLVALNQCMEWGQVFILDRLAFYQAKDCREAQLQLYLIRIIDKVLPRLSHINPSVVFSAIKVLINFLDYLQSPGLINNLYKKLGPSISSLVSWPNPQIQYVLLRNIHYIIQKNSQILQNQYKRFFINFNQPIYIKHQKMYIDLIRDILVRIINIKNYQIVLNQFKQYMNQSDPQMVCRAIRAIGRVAIKFQKSIDKTLIILSRFLGQVIQNIDHAIIFINQLLITFQTILRKYPSKFNFDGMFKNIVSILNYPTQSYAKQAAAWINGQYAEENFPGALTNIQKYLESFVMEERKLQLEVLTSAVKVFIKYPDEGQSIVINLLKIAVEEVTNPDVRDRAYIYWRMLSIDPIKTKEAVFGYRPNVMDNDILLQKDFLDIMIKHMGYTSSIFKKKPNELMPKCLADLKVIQNKQNIKMDEQQKDTKQKSLKEPKQKDIYTKDTKDKDIKDPKQAIIKQKIIQKQVQINLLQL